LEKFLKISYNAQLAINLHIRCMIHDFLTNNIQ